MFKKIVSYFTRMSEKIFNEPVIKFGRLGGYMHINYLVITNYHKFVVKVPIHEHFVDNTYNEYAILKQIEGSYVSPKVIFFDEESFSLPVLWLEYLPGIPIKALNLEPHLICNLLGYLQKINLKQATIKYDLESYFEKFIVERINLLKKNGYASSVSKYIAPLHDLLSTLSNASSSKLVHGDFRFENLIVQSKKYIFLIDWEYAGIGDLSFDLANLIVEHNLNLEKLSCLRNVISESLITHAKKISVFVRVANILWTEFMVALGLNPEYAAAFKSYINMQLKEIEKELNH